MVGNKVFLQILKKQIFKKKNTQHAKSYEKGLDYVTFSVKVGKSTALLIKNTPNFFPS